MDLCVTVNINRSTKIHHRSCHLKQLLPCNEKDIAEAIVGVFRPLLDVVDGIPHRPLGMQSQLGNLLGRVAFLLQEIHYHPSCIHHLLLSAVTKNLLVCHIHQFGHYLDDLAEIFSLSHSRTAAN